LDDGMTKATFLAFLALLAFFTGTFFPHLLTTAGFSLAPEISTAAPLW
jgi:hypothetical protein